MSISNKLIQAASGNAGSDNLYVEDVFATHLYDGDSSNPITINNGIDFAGEGGLFWNRDRNTGYTGSVLLDTERGTLQTLATEQISGNVSISSNKNVTYNNNGITIQAASSTSTGVLNFSNYSLCSWSFRKAEKFFDIVTYTGNGASSRTIAHSLGSVPGCMIVKSSSNASGWRTYHASLGATQYVQLQTTAAAATYNIWNDTTPTDSVFSISTDVNANGVTYVAYLFASDAGGFGDDGSENIIKCGSYTGNNSADGPTVTLGFEPQWVLIKESDMSGNSWSLYDMMRDGTMGSHLRPNDSAAEDIGTNEVLPQATGFKLNTSSGRVNRGSNYIYIAIRRPMKTPESGTEVFALQNPGYPLGSNGLAYTSGFPVDWALSKEVSATDDWIAMSRLQGAGNRLKPNTTGAEAGGISSGTFDHMTGWYKTTSANMSWMFKRATGFFDVVAWTGAAGTLNAVTHGLGVKPELVIVKYRTVNDGWYVYTSAAGHLSLEGNSGLIGSTDYMASTTDTSLNVTGLVSNPGNNPIAYLFATVAGVSKVGSYTGTGSNVDVDCGFSAGARFVLIKRTDSAGNWFIYDSVRGIVAGADSYLLLNSTAAEDSSNDDIDPLSSGFSIPSGSNVNASGGTYIFLAIA